MTLELHRLSVVRAGRRVLDEVTLRLEPGQVAAVLGENGAGKSTLLDVVCGLRPPAGGTVHLGGDDLLALTVAERARRVASLGQRPPDLPELVARERIVQGLFPVGGSTAALVGEVADELALTELLDTPLSRLSGGQQKRVHLARALVHPDARLFVLDEPFAFLDPGHRTRVAGALRRRAQNGPIVVFAGHHLDTALDCADIVLGLKAGRTVLGPRPVSDVDAGALLSLFAPPGLEATRPRA